MATGRQVSDASNESASAPRLTHNIDGYPEGYLATRGIRISKVLFRLFEGSLNLGCAEQEPVVALSFESQVSSQMHSA